MEQKFKQLERVKHKEGWTGSISGFLKGIKPELAAEGFLYLVMPDDKDQSVFCVEADLEAVDAEKP